MRTFIILLFLLFSISCKKENAESKKINKPKSFGGQTYIPSNILESKPKNPEKWKREAEGYLKMNEGDTITKVVYDYQKYKKQNNKKEEKESYNEFKNTNDFEYSEYWREKAYQTAVIYMNKRIKKNNPNCRIVSRGNYHPNYVRYIGGQSFTIKYYCEFDCDEDYINESYFLIDATYLGNNRWKLKIVDQQLTH